MRKLLSNHGLALLAIAHRPDIRLREIALEVGITERATQSIVSDLARSGYVRRVREGRRNRYELTERWSARRPGSVAELVSSLPAEERPTDTACRAIALACSDHRIQPVLFAFLASEGLLGRAELILWPGGGPALAGHDGPLLHRVLGEAAATRRPERLLYVSHAGCQVPDVPTVAGADPTATLRSVRRWARRVVVETERRLAAVPELWLINRGKVIRVSFARGGRRAASGLRSGPVSSRGGEHGTQRRKEG